VVIGTEAGLADPMADSKTEVLREWNRGGEGPLTCVAQKGARPERNFDGEDRRTWVVAAEARPEWSLDGGGRRTWVVAAEARPEWGIEAMTRTEIALQDSRASCGVWTPTETG